MSKRYDIQTYNSLLQEYNMSLSEKLAIQEEHFKKMITATKRNSPMKYFNWEKLFSLIKYENPRKVMIGLAEDWIATSDVIYEDGEWNIGASYWVESIWDRPVMKVYDEDDNETVISCFVYDMKLPEGAYEGVLGFVVDYYEACY